MTVEISLGISSNPRTWPVIDGRVEADCVKFNINVLHPGELFWRQLHFGDFDVAEMSMSSLMMTMARGDERWVGLPIFTTRNFFHTLILVRRDAAIASPSDLKGKRVGVPEYQQTAALWSRGVLQHEFGVSPTQMEFWMERLPSHSHATSVGFTPPPGVTIHQIPQDKSIGSMMASGELQAALLYLYAPKPTLTDRSTVDLARHPDVVPLFPDAQAEGMRYLEKTGLYHINHGMVIRRSLLDKHPWLALDILKVFRRANDIADREREEHVAYHVATGRISAAARDALRERFVEYGVASNRRVLETAARYSFEQGLTPRLTALGEIFAQSTLDE